jgi:hypothetical protein
VNIFQKYRKNAAGRKGEIKRKRLNVVFKKLFKECCSLMLTVAKFLLPEWGDKVDSSAA